MNVINGLQELHSVDWVVYSGVCQKFRQTARRVLMSNWLKMCLLISDLSMFL